MEQGSLEKLKYDKRLQNRAEWLDPQEREAMEAALPDVAGKAAGPEQTEAAEAPQPAPAAPSEAAATPEV